MEQTVQHYRFRLSGRGTTAECDGRVVSHPDGTQVLQVWCATPEQPHILLEAGPVNAEAALWPLFRRLCDYKTFTPLEFRTQGGSRGPGDWKPIPGEEPAPEPPPAGAGRSKSRGTK